MPNRMKLILALVLATAGCEGAVSDENGPGAAVAEITQVPPQVSCVRILAAGSRTVDRSFDVVSGQSSVLTLNGLPIGVVTFTGFAYPSACAGIGGSLPTWLSSPTTVPLAAGVPQMFSLELRRNGSATIGVDFQDDDGGSGPPSSDGGVAPLADLSFFVQPNDLAVATLGQSCSTNIQCPTGFCVDGVCCNTACGGQCQACNLVGTVGFCSLVSGGAQPVGGRPLCNGVGLCGGACNGMSPFCSYPTMLCAAPSCTNGLITNASVCGNGVCISGATMSCGKYACNNAMSATCNASCTTAAECAPGASCFLGICN